MKIDVSKTFAHSNQIIVIVVIIVIIIVVIVIIVIVVIVYNVRSRNYKDKYFTSVRFVFEMKYVELLEIKYLGV